jgi:hypothetical protein
VQEDGQPVPIIVTKCIEAVETQGASRVGPIDSAKAIAN